MKRLFLLVATAAVLATSCEKTEIKNEVINEIGFTSNVGKQTKAINDGTAYNVKQPFAVLAYSNQTIDGVKKTTLVIDNSEVTQSGGIWKANDGNTYYWPNDERTYMSFYAYSPALPGAGGTTTEGLADHQKMNGTLDNGVNGTTVVDKGGINISGYTHSNMYVDFMVADNVIDMQYTNANQGVVPVVFNHKMAQIKFNVKLAETVNDVKFTLNKITLDAINSKGKVENNVLKEDTYAAMTYTIYPATAETGYYDAAETVVEDNLTTAGANGISTKPVTMIPQTITSTAEGNTFARQFTIEYTIEGKGVAAETVTKHINLGTPAWAANTVYIYNLTIGAMHQITFEPSVVNWASDQVSAGIEVK